MERLKTIIDATTKQPTIINEESNFVVITYWWGNNVLNQNTARPCVAFYEVYFKNIINFCLDSFTAIGTRITQVNPNIRGEAYDKLVISGIHKFFKGLSDGTRINIFDKIIDKNVETYLYNLHEYCGISDRLSPKEKNQAVIKYFEKMIQKEDREEKKHYERNPNIPFIRIFPKDFDFKNKKDLREILYKITVHAILINKINLVNHYVNSVKVTKIREEFLEKKNANNITPEYNKQVKKELENLTKKKTDLIAKFLQNLKIKKANYTEDDVREGNIANGDLEYFSEFTNSSIIDILNYQLRYVNPMTFNQMIAKWEDECEKKKCNYLAVEYPEFTEPGGYQLAINAKPMFIQKALSLCGSRAVLYIDGDMYIRKYPHIFDMQDVDYMGRGWWMDPRASWKMEESIMFDPYTFETSGGIMYFSQSDEAKKLIELWVNTAKNPKNLGKADDRVLSLIFNTKALLCSMKIIQLPIEYLWLSLDYDERMLDLIYDYNKPQMEQSIFVEHPECLTSEDTASGAGASSNRTPAFYSFLENLTPATEIMHEYLFFPNREMAESFKDYFDYMNNTTYINDGNEDLIKKGLVDPANPSNNEQPLTIIPYDKKYGNIKHIIKEINEETSANYTFNDIAEINEKEIERMNLSTYNISVIDNNYYEINNLSNMRHKEIFRIILKLLTENKNVIYNPVDAQGYSIDLYNKLMREKDNLYAKLDFVFFPIITSYDHSDFYKPKIDFNQPILFRSVNKFLVEYLKMFVSLDDLSSFINNGAYELYSRTRIGYLNKKPSRNSEQTMVGGGNKLINQFLLNYENGLKQLYSRKNELKKNVRKTFKNRKFFQSKSMKNTRRR